MSLPRLNVWDFDDTLAESWGVVKELEKRFPEVEPRSWWHDPEISSAAAALTFPSEAAWALLRAAPGQHMILTGRVKAAVTTWLRKWSTHPDYRDAIQGFAAVESTSGRGKTAPAKAAFLAPLCGEFELHVYDDLQRNLDAIKEVCPNAHVYLVRGGHIVNPARYTSRAYRASST